MGLAQEITLTPEFVSALDLLDRGSNVFITGKAGTGKSTLVRLHVENTRRRTITVAPTGIAALNVDGYTIHRLFSFPPGVNEEYVRSHRYYPRRFAHTLSELETLIIDEVSMVRADAFDAVVAALELYGPNPGTPFGGVQLVLVGDLYQLPPVVTEGERAFIDERFGTPYFFSADHYEETDFPTVELSTVFRQIGDNRLVALLNDVREGAMLEGARAELNARTDPGFEPDLEEFWLTLATTNRIVNARNTQMLDRLSAIPTEFLATTKGELDGFEKPAEERLRVAPGAQVMLLNNEASGKWVNGSIGRVEDIRVEEDGPVVSVRLRGGQLVDVRRHTWEITRPLVSGGSLHHEVIGSFSQLPMKLAWAITIHKSQGQTLDNVVVDLTGGTFANGQLYVALSRCTSLDGLVLKRDVLPRDLKTDIRVRRFLNAASTKSALGAVYIAASMVGNEGGRYRPRPIEIAVVTEDGEELSTIVNPTMDLYSAQTQFGITTRDVQLAPLLPQAWAALSPLLAGRIPCGVRIDQTLGLIDAELKRNGIVQRMPLGVELPTAAVPASLRGQLSSPSALERARALRLVGEALQEANPNYVLQGGGGAFSHNPWGRGYLVARAEGSHGTTGPEAFAVGGDLTMGDDFAQILADFLEAAWERVVDKDEVVVSTLKDVERYFGIRVLPEDFTLDRDVNAGDVLAPGTRVCFTGEVNSPRFGVRTRGQMQELALQRGLALSENMTKTRTDVLVVAQRGTQSGKAKKAAQWGKPVLSAEEFLEWADTV